MFQAIHKLIVLLILTTLRETSALATQQRGTNLPPEFVLGKRVDATKLNKEIYRELYEAKVPVVLSNVHPNLDSEKWCESLVQVLESETIEYDSRDDKGEIESFETTLAEFLESLAEGSSDHSHSMYLMNEDILSLPEAARLANELNLPGSLFGLDIFQYFPLAVRPKSALIIGGPGARSFLHADPFEWVGWNLLLEGTKIWTFLPSDVPMELIEGRRNAPDAWGEYNLTAGWVSELDLFNQIGLGPSPASPTALNRHLIAAHTNLPRALAASLPKPKCFYSGPDLPLETALTTSQVSRCVQIVQREGEMVIIPPGWWHQVYHLTPSIAVAGQYCNDALKSRVFEHILKWCAKGQEEGQPEEDKKNLDSTFPQISASSPPITESVQNRIAAFLRELPLLPSEEAQALATVAEGLRLRLGEKKGTAAMEQLLRNSQSS